MKRKRIVWAMTLCGILAVPAWGRTFADYEVILHRKPFGRPPDRPAEPERVIPVHESFAASMVLAGIYELDDGNMRAVVIDRKDNSYFSLMVGQSENGIELVDADYNEGEVVLKKGDEVVVLNMTGSSGSKVLSSTEREDRMRQAEERRMSYAERRRQRQLERQKPVEIPKPIYEGKALEEHLQNYQMEILRGGVLPPLPIQLTPDRDDQLVLEGVLPPVEEDGYEYDYDDDAGYYDEHGNYLYDDGYYEGY